MKMTKGDILKSYEEAKDKRAQVRILAQLNLTSQERIVDILREQGVDGRAFQWLHPSRAKGKKEKAEHLIASEPKPETPRVKPRQVHDFERMAELFTAIHEDVMAGKEPPAEWITEFHELWLQNTEAVPEGEK